MAKIIIRRKKKFIGSAQSHEVYLHNTYMGTLKNGGVLELQVDVGDHLLSFRSSIKQFGQSTEFTVKVNDDNEVVELETSFVADKYFVEYADNGLNFARGCNQTKELRKKDKKHKGLIVCLCGLAAFLFIVLISIVSDPTVLCSHEFVVTEQSDATCTNGGCVKKVCSLCDFEAVEEIPVIPHSFGDWSIVVAPTTEKDGQQTRKCTICNYGENKTIKKSPISILSRTYDKDFVGGVEWTTEIKNNSNKTIKYITLQWRCYNAVGDLIYDEIDGENLVGIKITGPLESGETGRYTNASKFYNHSFASSTIVTIKVEFMDGEVIDVNSSEYIGIFD